ncbi:MAG: 6-carboxytetrahydropterin synthase [Anaerolineales bacterium]|nr:6-carboxytetrahydropterin synthase [Anaerolineales bacterium]
MPTYRVHVSKDYTVFAAGHFVTYDGSQCEPLHGHNYRAAVSVEGDLDENQYVFNFVPLKRILRGICDGLDHRMLLPTGNALLDITHAPPSYTVRFQDKTYVFPDTDVVQLPIANTTSENLARWIGEAMVAEMRARGIGLAGLRALEVEVEESFGQRAFCRLELPAA